MIQIFRSKIFFIFYHDFWVFSDKETFIFREEFDITDPIETRSEESRFPVWVHFADGSIDIGLLDLTQNRMIEEKLTASLLWTADFQAIPILQTS